MAKVTAANKVSLCKSSSKIICLQSYYIIMFNLYPSADRRDVYYKYKVAYQQLRIFMLFPANRFVVIL